MSTPLEHPSLSSHHPILTRERLRRWGYTDDAIAHLEIPRTRKKGTTVVDWGIVAYDKEVEGNFPNDPAMGNLATVDGKGEATLRDGSPGGAFVMPSREELEGGKTGGLGNPAQVMALILRNEGMERATPGAQVAGMQAATRWVISMRLGNDDVGELYQQGIPANIEQWVRICRGKMSGLSLVKVQAEDVPGIVAKGNRAIYFRPGASGSAIADKEDLFQIALAEPDCVATYYPGLWEGEGGMDTTNGERLAWFGQNLSEFVPILATDFHSPTRMHHLEKALPYYGMINGNLQEMATVFLNEDPGDEDKLTEQQKEELRRRLVPVLRNQYTQKNTGRTCMATITDASGCLLVSRTPSLCHFSQYLPSPFARISAKSKRGAGDARFAGQRLYAARRAEKWSDGKFGMWDMRTAVNVGQLLATLKIQPTECNALEGVTMAKMERIAVATHQENKTYDDIAVLLEDLRKA